MTRSRTLMIWGLLLLACPFGASAASPQLTVLDEIFVIGDQPGPPLWKVRSDTHVLWILGVPHLTPAKLKWHHEQVQRVVKGATEVIIPANDVARTAEERSIESKAQAAWRDGRELPEGQTLRSYLSPERYARLESVTRSFAIPQRNVERLSPGHATNLLLAGSARKLGMASPNADPVQKQIVRMAKRHKVPVRRISLIRPGSEYAASLSHSLMNPCALEALVAELDDGGAGWKAIASAWSSGNVGRLRALAPQGRVVTTGSLPCSVDASASGVERRATTQPAHRTQAWMDAVERALQMNASTLAVVDMSHLLEVGGLLDSLRSSGHVVVEPR